MVGKPLSVRWGRRQEKGAKDVIERRVARLRELFHGVTACPFCTCTFEDLPTDGEEGGDTDPDWEDDRGDLSSVEDEDFEMVGGVSVASSDINRTARSGVTTTWPLMKAIRTAQS